MSFEVVTAPVHPMTGRFRELDRARQEPHRYFTEMLEADPRMRGRVLDVGCGADYPGPPALRAVLARCARLDGVDPDPGVHDHPGLTRAWCGPIEEADVPIGAYDAVFTFWVLEHIQRAEPFMQKVFDALRPGGVLYAYTPHALHPFALISIAVQAARLKQLWRGVTRHKINEYPAHYRVNRRGPIVAAARRAGFASVELHYLPCVHWDHYFPRPLRFVPHLYDRALGIRHPRAALLLALRIEKGETAAREAAPGA